MSNSSPTAADLLRALTFALENYPGEVDLAPLDQLVVDSARQNERRHAYVKLAVPDEVVKGLRGRRESDDLVLLVRIPRRVTERSESSIILPGESG